MSYFLDRPEIIKVSLTNSCNYRCVMCYNSRLRQTRGFIKDYPVCVACMESRQWHQIAIPRNK